MSKSHTEREVERERGAELMERGLQLRTNRDLISEFNLLVLVSVQ